MLFRNATQNELAAVCALYQDAKNETFCVWNEFYPTIDDAQNDLINNCLYILCDGDKVIGALSVVPENEMDGLSVWKVKNGREIARIVVNKECHGHGYAAEMVKEIIKLLRDRGCPSIHLSAEYNNIPALKTYSKLGFVSVGEADMYGGHYRLLEMIL